MSQPVACLNLRDPGGKDAAESPQRTVQPPMKRTNVVEVIKEGVADCACRASTATTKPFIVQAPTII